MFDKPIKTLNDYQEFSGHVAGGYTREEQELVSGEMDFRAISHELAYNIIGLNEEAGEVAGKIKKAIRRGDMDRFAEEFELDADKKKKALLEVGDCLYYLTRCANLLGSNLEEVANLNRLKLKDRNARGVIKGEGDDR